MYIYKIQKILILFYCNTCTLISDTKNTFLTKRSPNLKGLNFSVVQNLKETKLYCISLCQ